MLSPVSKSISIYYQENLSPNFFFFFLGGSGGGGWGVASFLVPILHDFSYNVNVKSVVFFFSTYIFPL